MSEYVRAFLAFEIEKPDVKKKLTDSQKGVLQTGADVKLVEPENIHMTIRFLGDITLKIADKIFEEMQKVQFVPFNVHISGLGAFPNLNYPRVLWSGIAEGADQLKNVFNQLEPRLQSLGFQPDPKGFSPHLTIARVRTGRNKQQLADFMTENTKYDFGTVKAQCLRLKRSELTPSGPIYSTLKEYCPQEQR
jgi:2'-5' RNA ligase